MKQPRLMILFGSAAKGTMTDFSDVDVAVLQADQLPFTYDDYHALHRLVETVYETDDRRIDLVDLATANPLLRYEAVMTGKAMNWILLNTSYLPSKITSTVNRCLT